ncbi:MAG TPA: hypothetical protein OIM61_09005 [Clostridiaceae bacterium]|nr:hypothetical protein [Clostridiaceae bacterium]
MSKSELKEIIGVVIFGAINTFIACTITNFLGIYNTIILRNFSVIYGDITWEVVIFFGLSLVEAAIHEYINCKTISSRIYAK